jgi:NadR type nicotinamide-nucleotide adenylyltransferase
MAELSQTGVVIGKFIPLTLGHCHLIETALRSVQQLIVFVCSRRDDPIDGHLRWRWARDAFPQARVIHIADEDVPLSLEDAEGREHWKTRILRELSAIDVLFTSEAYGQSFADALGARHSLVDPERRVVPIQTAQVRENPLDHWSYLPAHVRPRFAKRVLIYGAESTGKSTLAKSLAEHYQTVYVLEYARDYIEQRGNSFTYDDIAQIAIGQMETEEAAAQGANKLLFCDTDLITTTIYSRHYFGGCPLFVQRLADERRYDLYLMMDVDLPWEADPQRDLPHRREEYRDIFRQELKSRRIPFVPICGIGNARTQAAIEAVDAFLRQQRNPHR